MTYYRKDTNDIDKFIINSINNINSEIESLDKRITNLENGNNNNVINNNEKCFYMIKEFQIPYEDYILLNKSYDYFKEGSEIIIRFSSDFSSYEKLPKDVRFKLQILDDVDEIIYTKDQNDKIKYNGDYTFSIYFNINKDIKNPVIQFFILKDYIDYFVPGEKFINGYYFRDCELYVNILSINFMWFRY